MATKTPTTRHETNPFIDNMTIETRSKTIKVSNTMGKENNVILNTKTGETSATQVVTHKKVDSGQFIKLFTDNIALTFGLNGSGHKTLNVLFWCVQNESINKDTVHFDKYVLDSFLQSHDSSIKFSLATFNRGIKELEEAQIIAKTIRRGEYFINPNFIFNGDRVAFTTLIERV